MGSPEPEPVRRSMIYAGVEILRDWNKDTFIFFDAWIYKRMARNQNIENKNIIFVWVYLLKTLIILWKNVLYIIQLNEFLQQTESARAVCCIHAQFQTGFVP